MLRARPHRDGFLCLYHLKRVVLRIVLSGCWCLNRTLVNLFIDLLASHRVEDRVVLLEACKYFIEVADQQGRAQGDRSDHRGRLIRVKGCAVWLGRDSFSLDKRLQLGRDMQDFLLQTVVLLRI